MQMIPGPKNAKNLSDSLCLIEKNNIPNITFYCHIGQIVSVLPSFNYFQYS